jgi:hypothetical protein
MAQMMHPLQLKLLREKHVNWAFGAPQEPGRLLSELQLKSGGGIIDFHRYKADFLALLQTSDPMLLAILTGSERSQQLLQILLSMAIQLQQQKQLRRLSRLCRCSVRLMINETELYLV